MLWKALLCTMKKKVMRRKPGRGCQLFFWAQAYISFAAPGQRTGLTRRAASQVSGCPPGSLPPQRPTGIFGWRCPTTATSNLPPCKPPPSGETLLLFKGMEEGSWKAANSASTEPWLRRFPPQLHTRAPAPGTKAQRLPERGAARAFVLSAWPGPSSGLERIHHHNKTSRGPAALARVPSWRLGPRDLRAPSP